MVRTRRTVLECLGGKSGLFLGAFAKLRKAIVSFVMSVRPPSRMEQLGSHWADFHEICYLTFRNRASYI